jgi:hypothetical protein
MISSPVVRLLHAEPPLASNRQMALGSTAISN